MKKEVSTSNTQVSNSIGEKVEKYNPKNKIPPVPSKPPTFLKLRRLNTGEKKGSVRTESSGLVNQPCMEKIEDENNKSKCDTCHILIDEVKKRGERIEKLLAQVATLEKELKTQQECVPSSSGKVVSEQTDR